MIQDKWISILLIENTLLMDDIITGKRYFLCIGAQKAGTSWVYANLCHHREIYMPPVKELHFFDLIGQNRSLFSRLFSEKLMDVNWRLGLRALIRRIYRRENLTDNFRLFRLMTLRRIKRNIPRYFSLLYKPGYKICGEITPAYAILDDEIVRRIHKSVPNLKVVFILRDPIERHWSMLRMVLQNHQNRIITEMPAEEVLAELDIENKRNDYLNTLRNWLKYFPPEQVQILFYEDLQKDQLRFINQICSFLGVVPFEKVPVPSARNRGVQSEMPVIVEKRLLEVFIPVLEEFIASAQNLLPLEYPAQWLQKALTRRNELTENS